MKDTDLYRQILGSAFASRATDDTSQGDSMSALVHEHDVDSHMPWMKDEVGERPGDVGGELGRPELRQDRSDGGPLLGGRGGLLLASGEATGRRRGGVLTSERGGTSSHRRGTTLSDRTAHRRTSEAPDTAHEQMGDGRARVANALPELGP